MSEQIPVPTAHNTPDGKQWVTADEYLSLRVAYSKARNALQQAAAAFGCQPDDDADLVEAAKLLVKERDTAVAKAASGAAGNSPAVPVSSQPVAWMCEWTDHTALYDSLAIAEVDADGEIVPQPLYRSPPHPASVASGTQVAEIARLAFDAGFGSSVEGFNGECAYDHLAPKGSTFEGDGSEPYERLKKSSVDAILRDHVADGGEMVEQEPVCWAVMSIADPPHRVGLHWSREFAERWARQKRRDYSTPLVVIPLYARSSPDVKEVGDER